MTKTFRVALVANVHSAYDSTTPQRVAITKSKAFAAGPDGVTFYAPGWRVMVFKSLGAAERKLASHPGFQGWTDAYGSPDAPEGPPASAWER